ncbi:MAG TPA: MraY family glycosyltransferase, partial [Bryobacteraceae bacterium]|nr:MraY family glycosyltransferase [Bryobacteraceae bacterium]
MVSVLLLSFIALAFCLVLTPLVRDVSFQLKLVDRPDGTRKLHTRIVPRTGGVAIGLAYALTYFVASLLPSSVQDGHDLSLLYRLAPAAAVMFATGLLDDLIALRAHQKLIGQIAAATLAYTAGIRIMLVAGVNTGDWWSAPVTILWLVGCANAFNLIDGVDGLAAGVGMVATLTTFVAAWLHGNIPLALTTLPLAAALLGFLRFNFAPATIFLGDSGSLLVGFLLGAYGVIWSQKSATLLGLTAPGMALALPLVDVGVSVIRRFLRRRPIFSADRGHIHHRLLDAGLTPRMTTLTLYASCVAAACLSLLQTLSDGRIAGLIVVLFAACSFLGIRVLRYDEFGAAFQFLRRDAFRHAVAT